MDINDNLQQINTFVKGMNTDVSDMLMDSSQYRYAENVRLVTNTDSNSGELRLVDGTEFFTSGFKGIKAMTSIRDMLIVVQGNDEIWIHRDGISGWKQIFAPKNSEEHFGQYLSLVTRWESPKVVKLYIADGEHQLMYINIIDGIKSTIYGIDNILMDVNVELKAPFIQLSSKSSGSIPPVKVQYAYRFYKLGGAATTLSPLSNIITLYETSNKGFKEVDTNSGKAIDITIPQASVQELTHLQIYRINYQQIGQVPNVSLVYDGEKIPEYTDNGVDVESSTLTDLLSLIKMPFVPKVIESKEDYLFAGNISYLSQELNETLNSLDVTAPSSGWFDGDTNTGYNKNIIESPLKYRDRDWKLPDDPNKFGGEGQYIKWSYIEDNWFDCDIYNNKYVHNSTTIINRQKPSLRHGDVYRYGVVLYDNTGKHTYAKWVADIMIPDVTYATVPSSTGQREDSIRYTLQQVGIKFSVKPELFTEHPEVSAVEIVRAPRSASDRIVIAQGIVGFPYRVYKTESRDVRKYIDTGYICPTGFLSVNNFYADSKDAEEEDGYQRDQAIAKTDNSFLMFACPEYAYQSDDVENLLRSQNNIYITPQYTIKVPIETKEDEYVSVKSLQTELNNCQWMQVCATNDNTDGSLNYYVNPVGMYQTWVWNKNTALDTTKLIKELFNGERFPNMSTYSICQSEASNIAIDSPQTSIKIENVAFPSVPDSNSLFGDDLKCAVLANPTTIGNSVYIPWSAPLILQQNYMQGAENTDLQNTEDTDRYRGERYPSYYPIGSTGKCILLQLQDELNIKYEKDLYFSVSNIKRNAVPYGGKNTIDTGSYMSFGNIIYKDQQHNVSVFDGDCYPGVFNYNASHAWYEPNQPWGVRQAGFYSVPIESDIDLSGTYGSLMVDSKSPYRYYAQDKLGKVTDGYTQQFDAYMYNTAYGCMPDAVSTSALSTSKIDTDQFDTRIHHSELKTNGEHIDNWLQFKPMNFIDVDSRFGSLTNLRLFKDKLLFWQSGGSGVLSVNERTVLNDIDENQIVLGTGGVLQRFDYISTIHGMKPNQYEAEVQSNTTQYWWDGYNKELLAYSGGMELAPLAKIKNVTNHINNHNEVEHPSLSYDVKFNELISNVVDGGSIIYNEHVQQFTSIYTFLPIFRARVNNTLYLTGDNTIYKWNREVPLETGATLFGEPAKPKVQYVVNKSNAYNKVFDITTFGGRFYGGENAGVDNLTFKFDTPLKQHSEDTGSSFITNREYDFRLAIPRNANSAYGDRMRGKTMQCELSSSSNSTDFSLQYIITKFRMSWS